MTYEETIRFLYALLPNYERQGSVAYKPGLDNMLRLCAALGEPQRRYRTIHVAGTNGKGSVCTMIAAVLCAAGWRTGLYTSPHILSFTERIKVNGAWIPQQVVVDFTEKYHHLIEEVQPSFFEFTTAMAFWYFANQQVDYAVVETGLGGRLDSTNVITPEVAVITHIAADHCDLLGTTLPQIATEKAGIIKENTPIVIGTWQKDTHEVFENIARIKNSRLVYAQRCRRVVSSYTANDFQNFKVKNKKGETHTYIVDLLGRWQAANLCTALAALELCTSVDISDEALHNGLLHAGRSMGLCGRWQIIERIPTIVADIAHNADGIRQTMRQISMYSYRKLYIIFGIMADKDLDSILLLLLKDAYYYFVSADSVRALPAALLAKKCIAAGLSGEVSPSVENALATARKCAAPNDFIYIGGSAIVVSEALKSVGQLY